MTKPIITQKELKEILDYNCVTGDFTWITKGRSKKIMAGDIAGSVSSSTGYRYIRINGGYYAAHRLAFIFMGEPLPCQVDHINHVKTDNSWANLRFATDQINAKNMPLRKTNKSGITGVFWDRSKKMWCARIGINNKSAHIKYSSDKFEAICARKSAEVKYGFHENHGR